MPEDLITDHDHELVKETFLLWDNFNQSRMLETWHDAQQIRRRSSDRFSFGLVDLNTGSD